MIKAVLFASLFLLLISGCRGSFDRPGKEETAEGRPSRKTLHEPMGMPEDYENVPAEYPLAMASDSAADSAGSPTIPSSDSADSARTSYESYRIQLFTSNTYGPAVREMNIAWEVFDREVHLDYEVPYYKVRVGDFATRDDAEKYLPAAKEAGYRNAWVVRVTINVQTLEDIYGEDIPPLIDSSNIDITTPEPANDSPEYPEN